MNKFYKMVNFLNIENKKIEIGDNLSGLIIDCIFVFLIFMGMVINGNSDTLYFLWLILFRRAGSAFTKRCREQDE